MSHRHSNKLSAFFPDRYQSHEESDERKRDNDHYSNGGGHGRYRYNSSRKELYVPHSHDKSYRSGKGGYDNQRRDRRDNQNRYQQPNNTISRQDISLFTANSLSTHLLTPQSVKDEPKETKELPKSDEEEEEEEKKEQKEDPWALIEHPEYDSQLHRLDSEGNFKYDESLSQLHKKSYRVSYDPEISKDKSKGTSIVHNTFRNEQSKDPRLESNYKQKLREMKRHKKIPYKHLPTPKFQYDKYSVGPAPATEVVLTNLGRAVNDVYLRNQLKSFGEVSDFDIILDPSTGIPLGIMRVKFSASIYKASQAAKKAVQELHNTKIDGNTIKVLLNVGGKVVEDVKQKEIKNRLAQQKLAEFKDKVTAIPSAPKKILDAIQRRQVREPLQRLPQTQPPESSSTSSRPQRTNFQPSPFAKARDKIPEIRGIKVPDDLQKYVKSRSFIFIASKYTRNQIFKNDVKKALETYDWTRVLSDKAGIFVVFNSPKEAKRCFQLENGKQVFSVNLFMDLQLPENYQATEADEDYSIKQRDVLDETTSLLAKEFEGALQKDIRTKIIAPAVLEFLSIENFPELKAKIQLPPPIAQVTKREELSVEVEGSKESWEEDITEDVFSLHKKLPKLPSFKKKASSTKDTKTKCQKSFRKRKTLPLSYSLNFEDDIVNDENNSGVSTPQLEKLHQELSENEPARKKAKKESIKKERLPLLYSSSEEDEDEDEDDEPITETKEFLPSTPDESKMAIDVGIEKTVEDKPEKDEQKAEEQDDDHSLYDRLHQPVDSEAPIPVYKDDPDLIWNLDGFQELIKDDEDFALLQEILRDEIVEEPLPFRPDYWAWKERKLANSKVIDPSTDLSKRLGNITGSHRSEGYSKIADQEKVEYLPHRKRVHDPLSTIQLENEESESSKLQSSRVNRANNRRFAYEVSNFNTDNEILTMNQLNKRKKPVSFARSAIHNWGLYALEPIQVGEMIIEYVGERIRQQVAEFREKAYLKSGIGSSYLFRVDENTVIDATKKGGIARFINHCCIPSCTAKIIKVEGEKRIVIYALRDIASNEELTYDYKFERETNDDQRVRCLCGASGCKGYLN